MLKSHSYLILVTEKNRTARSKIIQVCIENYPAVPDPGSANQDRRSSELAPFHFSILVQTGNYLVPVQIGPGSLKMYFVFPSDLDFSICFGPGPRFLVRGSLAECLNRC